MLRFEAIGKIIEAGVVAVVRAQSSEQAARIADACAEGGIRALEITFTVPEASSVIRDLAKRSRSNGVLLGAGTVLDSETARIAILEGAQFLVAPSNNSGVARLCNRYQIPYLPGAMSINDIVTAMEDGASIVKVFPGETLGVDFIKAVRGPLPQAP